jgi:hypothetical protein
MHTLAEGPKGLKCRTAIGSAFDSASTGTGAISLTETFAMTSTGMAFEGALVGTGTDKKEGEASVGPTMIEESVCLTFAGEGVLEP